MDEQGYQQKEIAEALPIFGDLKKILLENN